MSATTSQPAGGADPSMEDILASIRRILSEDETNTAPASSTHTVAPAPQTVHAPLPAPVAAPLLAPATAHVPEVLALDASMLVEEAAHETVPMPTPYAAPVPAVITPAPLAPPARHEIPLSEVMRTEPMRAEISHADAIWRDAASAMSAVPTGIAPTHVDPVPTQAHTMAHMSADEGLVAPEAAAAAASSMGSLLRKLAAEKAMPVYRNGPTLEDLVRDEMRPMLKEWLDANLPGVVERLVRAEIERVVNAAVR